MKAKKYCIAFFYKFALLLMLIVPSMAETSEETLTHDKPYKISPETLRQETLDLWGVSNLKGLTPIDSEKQKQIQKIIESADLTPVSLSYWEELSTYLFNIINHQKGLQNDLSQCIIDLNSAGKYDPEKPTLRILSLQGGGTRGLIEAVILDKMEKATGKKIYELFHLVAGTSAGGLVACHITDPDHPNMEEGITLTKTTAQKVFKKRTGITNKVAGGLFKSRYQDKPVNEELKRQVGNRLLKNSPIDVMYVCHDTRHRKARIFSSWEKTNFLLRDVLRSTTAAPIYFTPHNFTSYDLADVDGKRKLIPNKQDTYTMIDGGVTENNPTMAALMQAKKRYPHIENFEIVSLGTGKYDKPLLYNKIKKGGVMQYGVETLINLLMSNVDVTHAHMETLSDVYGEKFHYTRWSPKLDAETSSLDNTTPEFFEKLKIMTENMLSEKKDDFDDLIERLKAEKDVIDPVEDNDAVLV